MQNVTSRVPRIVITGPPGSGKSTITGIMRHEFADELQVMPEVASPIVINFGIAPGSRGEHYVFESGFQAALYHIQHLYEEIADGIARKVGMKALLCDKGRVDIAAHLAGGMDEYKNLFGIHCQNDYLYYDLVLCLGLPLRSIYDAIRGDNPARIEQYERSCELEKKLLAVWGDHPRFIFVPHTAGWDEKVAHVRGCIDDFIKKIPSRR